MPLQREFKGLSDHVGLYQAGRLPMELVPGIMPQISAEDFVSPPKIETFTGNGNATGVVIAAPQVPANEFRRVRWLGASWTTAAGVTAIIAPVVFYLGNYYGVMPYWSPFGLPGATTVNKSGVYFPGDGLVLESGQAVGWQIQLLTGAGNCTISGLYQYQAIGI